MEMNIMNVNKPIISTPIFTLKTASINAFMTLKIAYTAEKMVDIILMIEAIKFEVLLDVNCNA